MTLARSERLAAPAVRSGASAGLSRMVDRIWPSLALGPSILLFLVLTLLPVANLLAMSFHEVTWQQGRAVWAPVGSAHYAALRTDPLFRAGVFNTAVFAVLAVSLQMLLGFALALLTSRVFHGRVVYRTIFVLPILIPGIVIGAMWKLMYNFDFGIINQATGLLGLPPRDFLGERSIANRARRFVERSPVGRRGLRWLLPAGKEETSYPLFDPDWYLRKNPDVAQAGLNPLTHFMQIGAREGRNPSPLFDVHWYRERYPDVARSGVNPLVHYVEDGARSGRSPSALFDAPWYLKEYPDAARSGVDRSSRRCGQC